MISLEEAEVQFPDWKTKHDSGLVKLDVVGNDPLFLKKHPAHAKHQCVRWAVTHMAYEVTCACGLELFVSLDDRR